MWRWKQKSDSDRKRVNMWWNRKRTGGRNGRIKSISLKDSQKFCNDSTLKSILCTAISEWNKDRCYTSELLHLYYFGITWPFLRLGHTFRKFITFCVNLFTDITIYHNVFYISLINANAITAWRCYLLLDLNEEGGRMCQSVFNRN